LREMIESWFWSFSKPVLLIAHKTFRHGWNLEEVARNPGNPLRQKEKKKSQKNFVWKLEEFSFNAGKSGNSFHPFAGEENSDQEQW